MTTITIATHHAGEPTEAVVATLRRDGAAVIADLVASEVMDELTAYLYGAESYGSWSESRRCAWLVEELAGRRPLFPPAWQGSDDANEVLTPAESSPSTTLPACPPTWCPWRRGRATYWRWR